jgi:hypothetical protein
MLRALWSKFLFVLAAIAALFRRRPKRDPAALPNLRVAIVGGGIAGSGAAWALRRGGCKNVHLFEKMPNVGGNARVFHWKTDPPVTTGLSVLAWPDKYFHNYNEVCWTSACGFLGGFFFPRVPSLIFQTQGLGGDIIVFFYRKRDPCLS